MAALFSIDGEPGRDKPSQSRRGRRAAAVLIDLENILYDVHPYGHEAVERRMERVWSLVESVSVPRWKAGACNRSLAGELVADAVRLGLRLLPVPFGLNRADRALVDSASLDIPSSVEEVVLCSGDGDFIPLVWQQQDRGLFVTVIAPAPGLSRHLARIADRVVPFTPGPPPSPAHVVAA